jgi:hypothetical protein
MINIKNLDQVHSLFPSTQDIKSSMYMYTDKKSQTSSLLCQK